MNEDFKYDPEAEEDNKKYRLPFAICKSRGIAIQEWWTPKDAWEALKGIGINPSDQYSQYYEQLKSKREEEKRASTEKSRHRQKLKNDQLKSPDHNPDKNYQHKDGAIAGCKRSEPMDFAEADSGNVNPFFW